MKYFIFLTLLSLITLNQLQGSTYIYDLTKDGKSSPTSLVNVKFEDTSPGTVRLTIGSPALAKNTYIDKLLFNYTGDAKSLFFTKVTSTIKGTPTFSTGSNAFKGKDGAKFDILLDLPNSTSKGFDKGDSLIFDITSVNAITASLFNTFSTKGSWIVGGDIKTSCSKCTWIGDKYATVVNPPLPPTPVPEPSTYLLLGSILALLFLFKKKKAPGNIRL